MNLAEIAERFIRAAEVDRATPGHVGPSKRVGFWPQYVHTFADKNGWGKEYGDKLEEGTDRHAEERKAFWEGRRNQVSAAEIAEIEQLWDWLLLVDDEAHRRALLAWSLAKAGGRSFARWCKRVENIHVETGRRRKNRALASIDMKLRRSTTHNSGLPSGGMLPCGAETDHVSDIFDEPVPDAPRAFTWRADPVFKPIDRPEFRDFSWAQKRSERRRQQERKRQAEQAA